MRVAVFAPSRAVRCLNRRLSAFARSSLDVSSRGKQILGDTLEVLVGYLRVCTLLFLPEV